VSTPWGDRVAATAANSVSFLGWPGLPIHTALVVPHPLSLPIKAGERIGVAYLSAGDERAQVRLIASRAVPGPSLGWRLTHP
jgi:hypothetical protein